MAQGAQVNEIANADMDKTSEKAVESAGAVGEAAARVVVASASVTPTDAFLDQIELSTATFSEGRG